LVDAWQPCPVYGRSQDDVVAALRLWQTAHLREPLQWMVLAGCSPEEVAGHLQLSQSVVELAEVLFFDVRSLLRDSHWIDVNVIQPEIKRKAFDSALRLKAAYIGGPAVARYLNEVGGSHHLKRPDRLLEREILLQAKFETCLAAPIGTAKERARLIRLYCDYVDRRRKHELDKQKFRELCEQHRRAHELASRRSDRKHKVPSSKPEVATAGSGSSTNPELAVASALVPEVV